MGILRLIIIYATWYYIRLRFVKRKLLLITNDVKLCRETGTVGFKQQIKKCLIIGDRVKYWATFNEPNFLVPLGYRSGLYSPCRVALPNQQWLNAVKGIQKRSPLQQLITLSCHMQLQLISIEPNARYCDTVFSIITYVSLRQTIKKP